MITTKKELEFYIQADIIMNDGGGTKSRLKDLLVGFFYPNYIIEFLKCMRKSDYYSN